MKLKFKSITNLIAKFTPLALFAAMGLALAAPQTAQAENWYKFVIIGVKTNPGSASSTNKDKQFAISELALYDAGGNLLTGGINAFGEEYGLKENECYASHQNAKTGNNGPATCLFNSSLGDKWWANVSPTVSGTHPYVVMRLADNANPAASYNLAVADASAPGAIAENRVVTKWELYKSSDGVTWGDPISAKSFDDGDSEIPTSEKRWYNGGGTTFPPAAGSCFPISSSGPTLGEVTLTKTEATWNDSGWATLPTETVKNGDGTVLAKDMHYTIAWKNSSGTSATAATKADTYTLTVTGIGDYDGQTKTATYTVNRMEIGLPPATAASNVKIGTDGKPTTQSLIDAIPSSYKTTWGKNNLYVQLAENGQQTNPNTYQYARLQLNSGYVNNLKWADGTFGKQTVVWTINETRVEVTLNDNGGSGGQGKVMINPGSPMPSLSPLPTKADSQFGGYYYGDDQYYDAQGKGVRNFPSSGYPTELTAKWTSTSGGQWFRLIIKDVKGPTKSHIQLDELALYDVSFNRVNADLVEGSSATGLNFGECAYSGSGTAVADAPVGDLFDGNLDRNHMWARDGVSFTGDADYPTITMHLPSDAAPVVYYNFASGGETANRSGSCAPVSWRLERSTDGANWELFHEQTDVEPVVENDTWLVKGGTENPPRYVIRGDGKVAEWKKPPRQFIRLTILKTSDGGTSTKTVGPMNIAKIALYDAQGNSIIPTDATDKNLKIAVVNTYPQLKVAYDKPTVSDNGVGTGVQHPPRLTEGNTKWLISDAVTLSDVHWYIVTTNDSPLAAYDLRTALTEDITGTCKNRAVLAWRIETSATGEDDDWQFFDERDFSMYAAEEDSIPFTERTWYGKGSGGDPDPGKAFRPSFLNKVASSPLRIYDSDPDPLATGGDIVLKDGGDYIHVFTNASASATFEAYKGSMLEVLAVGAGGAGSVGGGNAGALAAASEFAVNENSSYTIQVGAGGSGNGGNSTITTTSGVSLSLTANGGSRGDSSTGKGGNNGAGEDGKPMSGNVGGAGGAGLLNAILGWDVTFAGGGGGAGSAGCGAGGLGGGGSQASSDYSSINGEPGLGGGGGGAVSGTAGVGGSGIVVIRVKDATGLSSVTLTKTFETYGNDGWNEFPTEVVTDGSGAVLKKGVDYDATWKDSVGSTVLAPDNVGVYTLTVTARGGRTGMLTATYTVNTRYIVIEHPSVETLYTGKLQTFDPKWAFNEDDTKYVVLAQFGTRTEVGTQNVRFDIINGYRGPVQWWNTTDPTARKDVAWTIKSEEFDIPLDKNGGSVDPNPSSVHMKTGVALPDLVAGQKLTRDYYTFAGYGDKWDGSGTTYYNENGTPVLASYPATGGAKMLFALWTATPYQVTLMKNDGTQDSEPVNATYNEYMPDVEVPDRTGWIFEGYFKNQDGTGDQYYNELGKGILKYTDENVTTLYAKWKADTVTVTLHGNGGTPDSQTVDATPGAAMPTLITLPTRTGYTFQGFSTESWEVSYMTGVAEQDVCNEGATVFAKLVGSGSAMSVNDVSFATDLGDATERSTVMGLEGTWTKADKGSYQDEGQSDGFGQILKNGIFQDGLTTANVTLKGLTSGRLYLFQLFVHDGRGSYCNRTVSEDGENWMKYGNPSGAGGTGKYGVSLIRRFVATGTEETVRVYFNYSSPGGISAQINAAQLRDLGATSVLGKYYNDDGTSAKNYPVENGPTELFAQWTKAVQTVSRPTQTWTSSPYNGTVQKPSYAAADGYTVAYSDGDWKNVGSNYTVTFALKPNWQWDSGADTSLPIVFNYEITKAEISAVTLTATSETYDGQPHQPTVASVTASGTEFNSTSAGTAGWAVTYSRNGSTTEDFTSVGTITVTVTGTKNLTGSASTTFTITAPTVTVTLDANGGALGTTKSVQATYGQPMPEIAPANLPKRTGYTFAGFFENQDGTGTKYYNADGTSANSYDKTTASTIYAQWTPITYTITFKPNGGTISGSSDDHTVDVYYDGDLPNATVATPPDQATGVTFTGYYDIDDVQWYDANGTPVSGKSPYTLANNLTLYAHWNAKAYYMVGSDAGGASSFAKSSNPGTSGWALMPDGTAIEHTVLVDCDYYIPGGATLRTPSGTSTFPGRSLSVASTLVIAQNANVSANIIAAGGNATATWVGATDSTLSGTITVDASNTLALKAYCPKSDTNADNTRKLNVKSTVTGSGNLRVYLGAPSGKADKSVLNFGGTMSGFTGNIVSDATSTSTDEHADNGVYILTISGSFGGGIASLPHDDDSVGSEIIVNYTGLTGAGTKGLPISSTTIPLRVKDSITFFGSSGFDTPFFPLMTFPADTTVNPATFTVYHAETVDGMKTPFKNLGRIFNSDGTITLVANAVLSAVREEGPKIYVDPSWLSDACPGKKTVSEYQAFFLSTNPNGVSAWAAYILGFAGNKVSTAALIEKTTGSTTDGDGNVMLTVALTDMPTTRTVDGCEVKYSLLTSTDATALKTGEGDISIAKDVSGKSLEKCTESSFEVPAPTGNHAYYRIRAHFIFKDGGAK